MGWSACGLSVLAGPGGLNIQPARSYPRGPCHVVEAPHNLISTKGRRRFCHWVENQRFDRLTHCDKVRLLCGSCILIITIIWFLYVYCSVCDCLFTYFVDALYHSVSSISLIVVRGPICSREQCVCVLASYGTIWWWNEANSVVPLPLVPCQMVRYGVGSGYDSCKPPYSVSCL